MILVLLLYTPKHGDSKLHVSRRMLSVSSRSEQITQPSVLRHARLKHKRSSKPSTLSLDYNPLHITTCCLLQTPRAAPTFSAFKVVILEDSQLQSHSTSKTLLPLNGQLSRAFVHARLQLHIYRKNNDMENKPRKDPGCFRVDRFDWLV